MTDDSNSLDGIQVPQAPATCRREFTDGRLSAIYTGGAYDQLYVVDRMGISASVAKDLYRPQLIAPPSTFAAVIEFTNRMIAARANGAQRDVGIICNICARHVKLHELGTWPEAFIGNLDLSHNHLQTLDWNLTCLRGSLHLHNNQLRDVNGLPEYIYGDLDLRNNQIDDYSGFSKVVKIAGTVRLDAPKNADFGKILPLLNVEFNRLEFSKLEFDGGAWVAIGDHRRVDELVAIENIINAAGTGRTAMLRASRAISEYQTWRRDPLSGVCPAAD